MALGRGCRQAMAAVFVAGSALLLFLVGALGPKFTNVIHMPVNLCLVEDAHKHIWDTTTELIDSSSCVKLGDGMELGGPDAAQYPLKYIVFYAQLPYAKGTVMSRLFQYILADMDIRFTDSDYPRRLITYDLNRLKFSVALGYRNNVKGAWHRLTNGNVSRMLQCRERVQGYYGCNHLPFFELGSCHHQHYLINFAFPSLPLASSFSEYRGLGPLAHIYINVIVQTVNFTKLWLLLKSLLCPLSAIVATWFLHRVGRLTRRASLIEKSLATLSVCLFLYNAPFELFSLFINMPWMLVVNDFRQGLFVTALFSFWIIYMGEHMADHSDRHVGHYWKELGIVGICSIFLFVYEFSERGIQVFFPFYSLWSDKLGQIVAWLFVGISCSAALLYAVTLVAMALKAYWNMRRKQRTLTQMSDAARKRLEGTFSQWKFLLVLTVLVALISVVTVTIPSEIMLFTLQQGEEYSYYSALLTGNYGLWNSYVFLVLLLYAPNSDTEQDGGLDGGLDGDSVPLSVEAVAAQRILAKHAQE